MRTDNQPPGPPGDEDLDGLEQAPAEVVPPPAQARGAFDLRQGKIKREGKNSLYGGIAALALLVGAIILAFWVWVVAQMRSDASDIDESQVKGDATLEMPEQDDATMRRLKAQKLQELEEARRREAAARAEGKPPEQEKKEEPRQREKEATGSSDAASTTAPDRPPTPLERKLSGGVVAPARVARGSAYPASARADDGAAEAVPDRSLSEPPTVLDRLGESGSVEGGVSTGNGRASLDQLGGTAFAPSKAVRAPPGKYLLRHNTYARCVLYTEIVTDYPGLIECRLTEPLYSADGSTVIAEAGDRLTGEQRAEVRPGQTRVFTSWTALETASGVRARLDSLGAGPMGASGTQAWIDNHYMQRFGGAVMLSMIQDALQIAANRSQKSNSDGYTVNNTENSVENLAGKALEHSINIPPTAYIPPGTVMNVIVARDIDFSSVFENR